MKAVAANKMKANFVDFCTLIKEHQKADLIDGVIYMASRENRDANELFVWLIGLVNSYVRRKKLGKVYGSRVAFRLDDVNSPEPDIGFVAHKRLTQKQKGFFKGPPDFVIEIVSPESVDRDYQTKRRQYEEFGVREYWIVDQLLEKVTVLRRGDSGRFRQIRPRKGILRSNVVSGLWLKIEWLWQEPLPDPLDIINTVLSGDEH